MSIERIQAVPFDRISPAILAKQLQMDNSDVKNINFYIDSIIKKHFQNLTFLEVQNLGNIRAYIYKQGIIAQVLAFLEFELSDVRTTLTFLYLTLENNSGGLADFICANKLIMDNATISSLYSVIDKSIKNSVSAGYIRQSEEAKICKWALARIYELQNSSQVISAMDIYRTFKY